MLDTNTKLKSGLSMPVFGLGTWKLGETPDKWESERAALRHAVECGVRHFDTAEMYGDGLTEDLLGEALEPFDRDTLFITSKVYPWNAAPADMINSCNESLTRLRTDYINLYLLHWPGQVPFEQTLAGAVKLMESGKIRAFGISNFDINGMSAIVDAGLSGAIDVNQVMYNPGRRGIEFDLLPFMQMQDITCMAYTPIEPALMRRNRDFAAMADELTLSPAELALAWHMTRGAALPIPKASTKAHVDALIKATNTQLSEDQLAAIDAIFPPPTRATSLDIL